MDDARPASPDENAPKALWLIALAALAPFPLAALAFAYGPPEHARTALRVLLTWSMVVLAFLGGVRWGLETGRPQPRWLRLVGSALWPALAWGLYLGRQEIGDPWSIAGFLCAFMIQWLFDHRSPDAASRFPRLSTTMTAGACVSLALALEQALQA